MPPKDRPPVKVLITIDTEAWPHQEAWREEHLESDIRRDIYGITEDGEFGLAFQADMLCDHGLKSIFFVEALFASVVGINPLRQIVECIRKRNGQAVELHAHPEWTKYLSIPGIIYRPGLQHFHQLPFEHQVSILDLACRNLRSAGVAQIRGFRAGNFSADNNTSQALEAVGVPFDFSYNAAFLGTLCKFQLPEPVFEPILLHGITEYPMSCFEDYPGHIRHAQLCACSFGEMRHALNQAWQIGWSHFVILSHSFELINRRSRQHKGRLNPTVLHRMENLCKFLKENNDRFETTTCESLDVVSPRNAKVATPLHGSWLNTIERFAEQAWSRVA